jgi:hypothetical protein
MKSPKLSVGILLLLLAAQAGMLAMAQESPPSPEESLTGEGSQAPRRDESQDGCCLPSCIDPCPCCYVQVDALFLQRSPRTTNQAIVVDPNTDTTFLSTSDLDFNYNPGLQATVGWCLCDGRALELSYFGLFDASSTESSVAPGGAFLTFPDNLVDNVFVGMDRVFVDYSSALHGLELNLPCCCGCCTTCCDQCGCDGRCHGSDLDGVRCQSVTWFAGLRYLNLRERLNIVAQRDEVGGVEEGAYNIRTSNNLYGAQLGARIRRTQGRFGWEATGKGGIFASDVQQEQSVTDFPPVPPLRPTVSSSRDGVAFIGELNLTGLYRLTDIWNLRAGYSLLWIEGVALAPDQLDFDFAAAEGGSELDTSGMFLHGVNFGLEGRW